ncbi:sulfite exporter TauE/SafE family protein [Streptomyces sp. ZAF1911]|uniref:urease accessory protein UreH domain-containing protein n=1 Tax=Streptomyces sp. ZAF1911 TaxID=2944129 RepID=UPI00237B444A|nr:sulfite exporter TauE/SafE family protein [Streptomyces sp. ZAF1911]MDD9375669.1 sulfite exporter TauE/SafE family protein [Streptomyces sp. ZAF1911]
MPSSVALLITGASTGLLAGGASCAAVQGGLLAGAVTRRRVPVPATKSAESAADDKTTRQAAAVTPLAPVGAFLSGKLLSHTMLGALLGVFGSTLQPSPRTQAVLLLVAGAVMVLFALDLIGVKGVGRLVPRPPASFGRLMRRSVRTDSVGTPALVGFATALVPCGVTLSMELLAVTSGSAVAGAAVMAGFVLGTAPLFALLGYVFRRSSQALSGKLTGLTGVVVLTVAAWTVISALQAGGWVSFAPPAAKPAPNGPFIVEGGDGSGSGGGGASPEAGTPVRTDAASGRQIVTLTVTDFYVPTQFTAKAGVPTTLVLHGQDSGGCARAFTIPELGVREIVKRDGDTEIDLGTRKPGTLRFSCAMGMQTGAIEFTKDL